MVPSDLPENSRPPPGSSDRTGNATALEPLICQYAGKSCTRPRALKLNGKLHRMCHYHRQRANANQRRSQRRPKWRRQHISEEADTDILQLSVMDAVPPPTPTEALIDPSSPFSFDTSAFWPSFGITDVLTTVSTSLKATTESATAFYSSIGANFASVSSWWLPPEPKPPPPETGWEMVEILDIYDSLADFTDLRVEFQPEIPTQEPSSTQSAPQGQVALPHDLEPVPFDTNACVTTTTLLSPNTEALLNCFMEGTSPPESTAPIDCEPMSDTSASGISPMVDMSDAGVGLASCTNERIPEPVGIPDPERVTEPIDLMLDRLLDSADPSRQLVQGSDVPDLLEFCARGTLNSPSIIRCSMQIVASTATL